MSTQFAPPIKRIVAWFIDSIILVIASFALFYLSQKIFGVSTFELINLSDDLEVQSYEGFSNFYMLSVVILLIGYFLYYSLQESGLHQATLGKRIMKLKVTDLNGDRISFARASLRFLGRIIIGFTGMVGYAPILFSNKKQGLHDFIAETVVLNQTVHQA